MRMSLIRSASCYSAYAGFSLTDVRFRLHFGLRWIIAPCLLCAKNGTPLEPILTPRLALLTRKATKSADGLRRARHIVPPRRQRTSALCRGRIWFGCTN
jgi:hypothetical protein